MKKRGFTLAEVLIALTLVGVIAAMTMPSVVTNSKAKTN
ncbi:type II secretion system protein, partial [bacterium]|nr:type II secretion system protein [bacterium]